MDEIFNKHGIDQLNGNTDLNKITIGSNIDPDIDRKLTTKGRKKIKEKNFALSGRRYPIHDLPHARSALSYVSRHGTSSEKKTVRSKVYSKYPGLKKRAQARKKSKRRR